MSRDSQILRSEFLTLPNRVYAALKRNCCLLQQFSLPLPADQAAALPRTEVILPKRDQGCDQMLDTAAPARRNFDIGGAPARPQDVARLPGARRINSPACRVRSVEIDLVAHRPHRHPALG